MSYISDWKSAPFDIFSPQATNTSGGIYNGYTGTGLNGNPDTSLNTLLGSKWATTDGRILSLVSVGTTAITNGVLVQSAAEVTAFEKMTVAAAAAVGTYSVSVTNGSTVMNLNQFAGGYLVVSSGSSILGQTLKIASHTSSAASGTITVTLEDPIQIALTTSCTVSFVYSPYANVIINPTTPTGAVVGATIYPLPASTASTFNGTTGALTTAGTPVYGYVVSHGLTGVLVDNTVTNVGYPIGASTATAGAVCVATLTKQIVGNSAQTLTSAQVGPIYLTL